MAAPAKTFTLLNGNGKEYKSDQGGLFGGHRRLRIYGRLDCPSALNHIARGEYVKHRVFFADEIAAVAAGYRPCGICMNEQYTVWKATLVKVRVRE